MKVSVVLLMVASLFIGVFAKSAEILPVDHSLGALVFELSDQRVLCHIVTTEGVIHQAGISCHWNPPHTPSGIQETSTVQFKFNQSNFEMTVERKKIGESLCYTLLSGSSRDISCLQGQ